jgi:hypothetical protein
MLRRSLSWSGAPTVMVITAVLVALDLADRSVRLFWYRHSFTSSVVAGVLVLLMTVLIADRVVRRRQLKNQAQAIAAQASVIVAQAGRAADAASRASRSDDDREQATDELRTYGQMLLISAPLLIDADIPRGFLEAAQHLAAQLFVSVRDAGNDHAKHGKVDVDGAVQQLRGAAAPLLSVLDPEQLAAVNSPDGVATDAPE